jgi:hypothetical protein
MSQHTVAYLRQYTMHLRVNLKGGKQSIKKLTPVPAGVDVNGSLGAY